MFRVEKTTEGKMSGVGKRLKVICPRCQKWREGICLGGNLKFMIFCQYFYPLRIVMMTAKINFRVKSELNSSVVTKVLCSWTWWFVNKDTLYVIPRLLKEINKGGKIAIINKRLPLCMSTVSLSCVITRGRGRGYCDCLNDALGHSHSASGHTDC